jgi:hypothetical protein
VARKEMFGAGRGWGTGRGGGRGGFHRGGGRGMAGGGRGRGGEVFGSKKMVKVGGELVEKQPHVPLRGGGSGAPRGGMARSTSRGCGVVAGGSSSSSSSRGGISSSLPRGRGSSWKPPPKPASSHQAAQADRVFESKKMVRVGDTLYSKVRLNPGKNKATACVYSQSRTPSLLRFPCVRNSIADKACHAMHANSSMPFILPSIGCFHLPQQPRVTSPSPASRAGTRK